MEKNQNEIILYQPDDTLALNVRVEDESVWLTQAQMAELFQTTRNNITLHTRNIFKEGELVENSVCKESLLTAGDGKVDFFVRSSLQPREGVFFNGQITKQLRLDVDKHNAQYPGVTLYNCTKAQDRFLIIDEDVYHIGASLKDLGKKLFAFSKMEVMTGTELLAGL